MRTGKEFARDYPKDGTPKEKATFMTAIINSMIRHIAWLNQRGRLNSALAAHDALEDLDARWQEFAEEVSPDAKPDGFSEIIRIHHSPVFQLWQEQKELLKHRDPA